MEDKLVDSLKSRFGGKTDKDEEKPKKKSKKKPAATKGPEATSNPIDLKKLSIEPQSESERALCERIKQQVRHFAFLSFLA